MAVERIEAWLRLRNRARFSKDANQAARDIRDIGDAAHETDGASSGLGRALGKLTDHFDGMGSGPKYFGIALGVLLPLLVGMIPIVVGLSGALIALAGSLALAALGIGALATAGIGVAAVGLGSLSVIAFKSAQNFEKVWTALQQWQLAVKEFGKNSDEAATAQANLNAVVSQFGGRPVLMIIKQWQELTTMFDKLTKPAMKTIFGLLEGGIKLLKRFAPQLAAITNGAAASISGPLQAAMKALSGREIQGVVGILFEAFKSLSGPVIRTVVNLVIAFGRTAAAAAPFFVDFAKGVERLTDEILEFTRGRGFGDTLGTWVDNTKSWWGLLKSVGKLLFNIFSGGANEGQGLVDTVTKIVDGWNRFLESAKGKNNLAQFFKDSVAMTKMFFAILAPVAEFIFKFGRALVPIYTKAFAAVSDAATMLIDAFKPAEPFFKNVLIPLLDGLVTGVLGTLVGAFKVIVGVLKIVMTALGWLGGILKPLGGVFKVIGAVIGFIFGGAILKAIALLGKIVPLLRGFGTIAGALYAPIRAVGAAFEFIGLKVLGSLKYFGTFGQRALGFIAGAFTSIMNFIERYAGRFIRIGGKVWNWITKGLKEAIASGLGFAAEIGTTIVNGLVGMLNFLIPNKIPIPGAPDINLPDNPIPKLANGGVIGRGGLTMVGEQGPEVLALPSGSAVVPLSPASASPLPQGAGSTLSGSSASGPQVHISKVFIGRKQVAEAVAEYNEDQIARA